MMLIDTYIAPSAIEGVGVFANAPIPAGQLIWCLDPAFDRILSADSLDQAPPHLAAFLKRYAYPLHDRPDQLVLEVDNGRFMNHSDQPNTDFTDLVRGYARRAIALGEELTCNYAEFDPTFELLPSVLPPIAAAHPAGLNGTTL